MILNHLNFRRFIGHKVRLVRDVERFPNFIAWENMTGVIVDNRTPAVLMDEKIDGCEEWENQVLWNGQHKKDFSQEVQLID
jgi:hypothetical protein